MTKGGHNAGIVSEPGHPGRYYRVATKLELDRYRDPEAWCAETPTTDGSWWPEWVAWLTTHSGRPVDPPAMGATAMGYAPVHDAPGMYVLER